MHVSEAQRLKALDDENRQLKTLVADLSLDKEMLKAVIQKNDRARLLRTPARPETLMQVPWYVGRNGRLLFGVL